MNKLEGRFDVLIEQKGTAQASRLFSCDKIELRENHIMVYRSGEFIYKVWLQREDYKDLNQAMKDVGMSTFKLY
ncbi:MAG: hypothetical protein WCK90_02795 [archaeon]